MAQSGGDRANIYAGNDQKGGCGVAQAMKGNHGQLVFRWLIRIVAAKYILEGLIWGGVVHHLAVVLDEDPVIALPEVPYIGLELFS